jgi:hypothetical protein
MFLSKSEVLQGRDVTTAYLFTGLTAAAHIPFYSFSSFTSFSFSSLHSEYDSLLVRAYHNK